MRGARIRFLPTDETHRVTTLELLFDLVFVYALTADNGVVDHRLSGVGVAQGLVVMALIWFGWAAYAWLGNQARADEGPLRVSMFVAMAGFFVVALAIHEAFEDLSGGLRGPVLFVVAYAVIRLAHLTVYWVAAAGDVELRHTIRLALATTLLTLAVLLVGAFLDTGPRLAVWVVAVLIDYVGVFLGAAHGWRVFAPGHFAERHGLVIIIAIGESLVSVAEAVAGSAITWSLLVAGLLGVTLAIALWRTYFNAIAVAAEERLRAATGDDRTRLARDVFTYLHLPLVIGIVGMAIGLRVVLDRAAAGESDLPATAIAILYGGAAVYLAALAALRWRLVGTPSLPRLVVACWLLAVGTVLALLGAGPLVDVAVLAASFVALVGFDAVRYGQATRAMRLGGGRSETSGT
jgi:low temperature requirement protein LtrA